MKTADILISEYRKSMGISQSDLAGRLTVIGYPTTNKMVSSWEKGGSVPNANQYLAICKVLGIDNDALSQLNLAGQLKVQDYINTLCLVDKYRNHSRTIPLYSQPVSAGDGVCIDDDNYEELQISDRDPHIDYAVTVYGDSMEPRYKEGDIVYVRSTDNLKVGDIGIFNINGMGYIKVLGKGQLISINEKYVPINIGEYDNFKIQGKVVY